MTVSLRRLAPLAFLAAIVGAAPAALANPNAEAELQASRSSLSGNYLAAEAASRCAPATRPAR